MAHVGLKPEDYNEIWVLANTKTQKAAGNVVNVPPKIVCQCKTIRKELEAVMHKLNANPELEGFAGVIIVEDHDKGRKLGFQTT